MAYGEEGRIKKEKATWGDIVEEKRRCSDGLWIVDNNESANEKVATGLSIMNKRDNFSRLAVRTRGPFGNYL